MKRVTVWWGGSAKVVELWPSLEKETMDCAMKGSRGLKGSEEMVREAKERTVDEWHVGT